MGVPGVALATVIAQGISALLCLFKLMRMKEHFDLNWSMLKLDRALSLRIIKLGLPSGGHPGYFSLAMIVVQSLTNSFGELVIAANVIVMRVDGFAMMPNFPSAAHSLPLRGGRTSALTKWSAWIEVRKTAHCWLWGGSSCSYHSFTVLRPVFDERVY